MPAPSNAPRCAHCGLDCAAWIVVRGNLTYCSDHCSRRDMPSEPAPAARGLRARSRSGDLVIFVRDPRHLARGHPARRRSRRGRRPHAGSTSRPCGSTLERVVRIECERLHPPPAWRAERELRGAQEDAWSLHDL